MDYEIHLGPARAAVSATGATLRAYTVDGVPFVETFPAGEPAPMSSGAVLLPWPNRTADAAWPYRGESQHLTVSEPARDNAIHGLVRDRIWALNERSESAVTLSVEIADEPGWPFRFRTAVTYALEERGLVVTHTIDNLSDRPMPFGLGAHPYVRAGATDVDDCEVTLAATTRLPLDPVRLLPARAQEPARIHRRPMRGLTLDGAFGGCVPSEDGLVRHTLMGPDGGVEVWADPVFGWTQVYTPAEFPGRPGRAIAIEPMTCPPDALNSGVDLLEVAPGGSWSAAWGITPVGLVS
ncbi:MAG TPA: aldose 1-epimerase family protein [Actinokineospora sp.]|jgi:aldose 1-epimerase|nr:aldose 1-epimerase family protein [Actinokineospora sp.]